MSPNDGRPWVQMARGTGMDRQAPAGPRRFHPQLDGRAMPISHPPVPVVTLLLNVTGALPSL